MSGLDGRERRALTHTLLSRYETGDLPLATVLIAIDRAIKSSKGRRSNFTERLGSLHVYAVSLVKDEDGHPTTLFVVPPGEIESNPYEVAAELHNERPSRLVRPHERIYPFKNGWMPNLDPAAVQQLDRIESLWSMR